MVTLISKESTNPGNIGGYKNTRNVPPNDLWHRAVKLEPKKVVTEKLSDIVDMISDQHYSISASENFSEEIKPHTLDNLVTDVCKVLKTRCNDEMVRKALETFSLNTHSHSAPIGIDKAVYEKAYDEVEDAVVEYCAVDAKDVLERLYKQFKGKENQLTSDVKYGTILKAAISNDYDLIDKIHKIYEDYLKKISHTAENKAKKQPEDSTSSRVSMNTIVTELRKEFGNCDAEVLANTVKDLVTSEIGVSLLKQILSQNK